MKITYTGKPVELSPQENKKLENRFAKIGKLLSGKQDVEAHIVLKLVRHQHKAEATIRYYDQQLVGEGSSSDLFEAIVGAAKKLEKQAVKARTKWRDNKRGPRPVVPDEPSTPSASAKSSNGAKSKTTKKKKADTEQPTDRLIYHVEDHKKRKPMTLDEAMLEMDGRDYLVYRDAKSDKMVTLIRRRDGHFDLLEA